MRLLLLSVAITLPVLVFSQRFDLLIKDGHLIDAKNNIDQLMDVTISNGAVAKVASNIPDTLAAKVIDAKGLYVFFGG